MKVIFNPNLNKAKSIIAHFKIEFQLTIVFFLSITNLSLNTNRKLNLQIYKFSSSYYKIKVTKFIFLICLIAIYYTAIRIAGISYHNNNYKNKFQKTTNAL